MSHGDAKHKIQKKYVEIIRTMIEANKLEKALDLNIRKYEEALGTDDISQIAYCIYCFGLIEETSGNIAKAMTYYIRSTRISREYEIEECLVASLNNRGNIYSVYGELHLAISKYIEALMIIQNSNEWINDRVKILNNIGVLYIEIGDLQKASEYTVESLGYAKKTGDEELMCKIYGNVTEIFLRMGDLNKTKYYNRSHSLLAQKNTNLLEKAFVKVYEALIQSKENAPWNSVQGLFEEGVDLFDQQSNLIDKYEMINLFARECIEREQYKVAIYWLEAMLNEIKDKQYRNIEITALTLLEEIYKKQNNIFRAYEVLSRLAKVKEYAYVHLKEQELERVNKTIQSNDQKQEHIEDNYGYDDVKKLQKSIQILKTLSKTGQHITSCTRVEDLVETFYKYLDRIFSFDGFGIGIKSDQDNTIHYYYYESSEGEMHKTSIPLYSHHYLMSLCVQYSKEIIIYDVEHAKDDLEEENAFTEAISKIVSRSSSKSILFSPIRFENKTMGGITIQSSQERVFSYVDLESLRIIASYVAIAVTNIVRAHELVVANKKLRDVSLKDGLTDVFNRRALAQYIQDEFRSKGERNLPSCAMMLDVDFFKQYNDNYGHVQGDQCLKKITSTLHKVLRHNYYHIFRYGGDEFFILVERCNKKQSLDLLENLIERVKELNMQHEFSDIASYVTVSVGAKIIYKMPGDLESIFNEADQALYQVKENGRNSYQLI